MPCNYKSSRSIIESVLESDFHLEFIQDLTPSQLNHLYDKVIWDSKAEDAATEVKDKKNLLAWIRRTMPELNDPKRTMPMKALLDGSMELKDGRKEKKTNSHGQTDGTSGKVMEAAKTTQSSHLDEDLESQIAALLRQRASTMREEDHGAREKQVEEQEREEKDADMGMDWYSAAAAATTTAAPSPLTVGPAAAATPPRALSAAGDVSSDRNHNSNMRAEIQAALAIRLQEHFQNVQVHCQAADFGPAVMELTEMLTLVTLTKANV